jgi:hypothetical protein
MKAPVNSSTGGTRQIAPEGAYPAVLIQIIDKGTTLDEKWGSKKRKVQFVFELPTETAIFKEENGEQPFIVKTIFNLNMGEKSSLRKFIESWAGKKMTDAQAGDFEIFKLLGVPCMLNVAHNGKEDRTYANIMSVSPLPKGMQCPAQINELLCYDTTDHNAEVFNKLPEFLQEDIRKSDEWIARNSKPAPVVTAPAYQSSTTEAVVDDFFNSSNESDLPW